MKQYFLDIENSLKLYNENKDCIKAKDCYMNIFHILTNYNHEFQSKNWKIAYGYISSLDNIYCRHCFIIDSNDKILDPTIFANTNIDTDRVYYAIYIFNDIEEYLSVLDEEDNYPALSSYLLSYEINASRWANSNGLFFIG